MVLKLGEEVRSGTDVILSTIKLLDYVTVRSNFVGFNHLQNESKTYNMYTMFFYYHLFRLESSSFALLQFCFRTTTTTCDYCVLRFEST